MAILRAARMSGEAGPGEGKVVGVFVGAEGAG